jgi:hypothetical protein
LGVPERGFSSHLIDIQVVFYPFFKVIKGYAVLFGADVGHLLQRLSICTKMLRLLSEDLFSPIESSF